MENTIILSKATNLDISGVLDLQGKYLVSNLTDTEKLEGFVTTPFTSPQIERIIMEDGLFVAKEGTKLIAYVFAGSWDYFSQWPIFPFMTNRFPALSFRYKTISTTNSFQYGPICIDMKYRGTFLLEKIFEFMRLSMRNRYPIGVTFINKINNRSYNAHTKKLKWTVIDEFEFNRNNFWMLAYDMDNGGLE